MKIEKITFANALALTTLIVWVVCSAFVAILPGLYMRAGGWWMHMNYSSLTSLGMWPMMSMNGIFFGGFTMVIAAWIAVYIFVWIYEQLGKSK